MTKQFLNIVLMHTMVKFFPFRNVYAKSLVSKSTGQIAKNINPFKRLISYRKTLDKFRIWGLGGLAGSFLL